MTREWAPGDVAMVDSWRGKGQIAFRCERVLGEPTWCVLIGHDTRGLDDDEVTEARAVIVIDPEDREQVERLSDALVSQGIGNDAPVANHRVRQALREFANPKPPRIEEPTGLGAVVEDAQGQRWVRGPSMLGLGEFWMGGDGGRAWADIDAVRKLSDGV